MIIGIPTANELDEGAPVSASGKTVCLILSALSLGIAIQINNGLIGLAPIFYLSVSIFFSFAVFTGFHCKSTLIKRISGHLPILINTAIAIQFLQILLAKPQIDLVNRQYQLTHFGLIGAMVLSWLAMNVKPGRSSFYFISMLFFFCIYGCWLLGYGRLPRIDVWTSQTAGLDHIVAGRDPWSSTFADLYNRPGMYAQGTVVNGMVQLGFPYPPMTVLLDWPGYYWFHDFRFSNLMCMVVAVGLIGFTAENSCRAASEMRLSLLVPERNRTANMSQLAAVLFLTTPRVFLVLQNAWTEPTVTMLFAATIFCAVRKPRLMPWMLGLFLASKQYVPLAALPAILLLNRRSLTSITQLFFKAGIAGCIISMPLIAWNIKGFIHSNLTVAAGAGFRMDALSYIAFFAGIFDVAPSQWMGALSFIMAIAIAGFVLQKSKGGPAEFSAGMALVFLTYFSLNKFAFCNYYYFIVGVMCTAIASSHRKVRMQPSVGRPLVDNLTPAVAAA